MNFKIDLKSLDLKNLTMDDIKAKLQAVEKKTWIKIGIASGAVILFLIIYYGVISPIVDKKKAQLVDMNKKQEETSQFIKKINLSKKKKILTNYFLPMQNNYQHYLSTEYEVMEGPYILLHLIFSYD